MLCAHYAVPLLESECSQVFVSVKNFFLKDVALSMKTNYSITGIRCQSCLRKLRAICSQNPQIEEFEFDMSRSLLQLSLGKSFLEQTFIKDFSAAGFGVKKLSSKNTDSIQSDKKSNQSQLIRLAVTGALAGNIMMFSFSDYFAGDSDKIIIWLRWFSGALYLPVLVFSARPLFENTWASLRRGAASVDIPLALTIAVGSILSYFNLTMGSKEIYFDSLSMFIFLLLSSSLPGFLDSKDFFAPFGVKSVFRRFQGVQ